MLQAGRTAKAGSPGSLTFSRAGPLKALPKEDPTCPDQTVGRHAASREPDDEDTDEEPEEEDEEEVETAQQESRGRPFLGRETDVHSMEVQLAAF